MLSRSQSEPLAQPTPAATCQTQPAGPELRPLHLPAEPGWFPPAPGWWLLAALFLLAIGLAVRTLRRRQRERHRRQAARRALAQVRAAFAVHADERRLLTDVSALLRRAALQVDPRSAGLNGAAWGQWLDQQIGREAFSSGPGAVLLDGPYRPTSSYEPRDVLALCEELIGRIEQRLAASADSRPEPRP
jgi:hypothetical protein